MSNKSIGVKVCEISVSCLDLFESKLKFDRNVFRSTKHLYRSGVKMKRKWINSTCMPIKYSKENRLATLESS